MTPEQQLHRRFIELMKNEIFYQDLFKLKFSLEEHLRSDQSGDFPSTPLPPLSISDKLALYRLLLDLLFKTKHLRRLSQNSIAIAS